MNIPELQGPPACMAGLVFEFPLHFTDLDPARVLIYGVHIAHIKLSLQLPLSHAQEEVGCGPRGNGV